MTLAAVHELEDAAYDWVNHATAFLVVGARCGDGVADLGAEIDYAAAARGAARRAGREEARP